VGGGGEVVVKRVIFVTFGLIFALLMTLFPVSMVVGSSGLSVGTGFEPWYYYVGGIVNSALATCIFLLGISRSGLGF
jgi:hypothetical protein